MQLYLTQHGKALDKTVDPERSLSDQGRQEIAAVADYLRQADTQITSILHSGKTRAAQTAEIFADILQVENVAQLDGINPNDDVQPIGLMVSGLDKNTMVVSHIPFLPRLLHLLLTGEQQDEPAALPGNMVCLERSDDQLWLLSGSTGYDSFTVGDAAK